MNFKLSIFALLILWGCVSSKNEKLALPQSEAELGKLLFFDPVLSLDQSISCASCHIPAFQFADTSAVSIGVYGHKGFRNTPSVTNMASRSLLFWDGRANDLESQALFPISDTNEMALPLAEAIKRLKANKFYVSSFKGIYNSEINEVVLGKAISAFEKTLETNNTPFDRFMNGDDNAISESAKRGQQIFNVKAKCFDCHFGPDFTGDEFKNIGLFNGKQLNDSGRFNITKNTEDLGSFKVPGLRNIALTAPYMHNGMFKNLEQVIEYYNNPDSFVSDPINRDTSIQKLNLTETEKADLLSFLKTLNN